MYTHRFLQEYAKTKPPLTGEEEEEELGAKRAGGEAICEVCGKTFNRHPLELKYLSNSGEPYLNRICNGLLVKL